MPIKHRWEKWLIFDKKCGLTPLEIFLKLDFRCLKSILLFSIQNIKKESFLPGYAKKIWNWFIVCFLGNLSIEILFVDVLERKEGFLEYKNLFWNSGNILIFQIHDFGQKCEFFHRSFFEQNKPQTSVCWYSS